MVERRKRLLLGAFGTVIALVLGTAYALKDPSPIGYFTSGDAQNRFLAAYDDAMDEMPTPDRTLDVRTTYGVVRLYRFAGADPGAEPLVLLPGRASASPLWADNLPSLLKRRSVYTIDLLGEPGYSVQQRPITTPADHARWLHEALLALPEPRVHLLGWSIGGWTAANLAVREPAKIASVALFDPVVVFGDLSGQAVIRSLPASVKWFPKSWRDSFASWTANDAPVEDEPVARMIEEGLQSYVIKLSAPTRPTDEQLRSLRMPTLVVFGGESRMHDPKAGAENARRVLRHGTVKSYDDASHAVPAEYPDRVAADVDRLLT
ncbi:alpha/beta hydrolase [Cryptosporangium japonicum]|uniref:Alpha/beta hydrolase n=1 Tax=Cryptosporangium japonicum TaxID=80872 RepID=A0ABN0UMC8_9ACTN